MGIEKSAHHSLRPPRHGYPPHNAPPSSWALLDLRAYIADRENATSACCRMSSGKAIRVTFCTAPPPLVSYICVWCPDAEIAMEPSVEAADGDLVLLRVSVRGRAEFFVYKASGPSLHLLPDPEPCLSASYNIALLARRDVDAAAAAEEDDDGRYYVAALNRRIGSRIGDFQLWVFDSEQGKWSSTPFSLDGIYLHIMSKTIALGDGGLLGFIDPWRGIVVCDVLGRRPARYLPLPPHLIRLDKLRDEPLRSRDFAVLEGRLRVIELSPVVDQGSSDSDYWSWELSSWSRAVTDHWEDDWEPDYTICSGDVLVDSNTDNVGLLPALRENNEAAHYQASLAKLYIAHPTLSLSDEGVVYLMGKVHRRDKKALVLSVDTRIPRVQGVTVFDAERMFDAAFSYT